MFNKTYIIRTFDGQFVDFCDLKELIAQHGLGAFWKYFGNEFKQNQGYSFVITNQKGKIVPVEQIVYEYIEQFPNSEEVKNAFAFQERWERRKASSGFKSARWIRPWTKTKVMHYLRYSNQVEEHEGHKIRLVRTKQRMFARSMVKAIDDLDYERENERNWKSYRKTQYK